MWVGRGNIGWATDRSLKDGGSTPSAGRWPAKAAPSSGNRRKSWAAKAIISTILLMLIASIIVQIRLFRVVARALGWSGGCAGAKGDRAGESTNGRRSRGPRPRCPGGPSQGQPESGEVPGQSIPRPPRAGKTARTRPGAPGDIDLATSSIEGKPLARRLSDQDIQAYLAAGGQPLVDSTLQSPELRRVYAQTLLHSFRREMDRRRPAAKVAGRRPARPRQESAP